MVKKKQQKRRGKAVRARSVARDVPVRPGRRHTKPLAILYVEGMNRVCAMLIQPDSDTARIEQGSGVHSALGFFMDKGYAFGSVRENVPEWAKARVPKGCRVMGCANITRFPL